MEPSRIGDWSGPPAMAAAARSDGSAPSSRLRGHVLRAALIILGWTLVALFLFSKNLAARMLRNDPTPWACTRTLC